MAIYQTIDHSKSFQGQAPWVQAPPLGNTVLPAPGKHTATIILLHGFANSGAAWVPIAKHLQTSQPHIKFILPNASIIKVHVPIAGAPGEAELPAWWDPLLAGGLRERWSGRDTPIGDVEGFKDASGKVEKIIEEESRLVGPGRVFLGGLSQGTVLSLAVGLENDKIGGIIALSSSLSVPDSLKSIGTPQPSTLKKAIFWAHGATQSVDYLVNHVGFKKISRYDAPTAGTITWSSYEGLKHETNIEELEDIQNW
ncbi:alpha/beta-hydrolase [Mollisia scopiformis]|uniref:Acyl-protein thioesterase 1 n=1 Tax=Mollisia scopiformis TaxID=149040 RepID=A0A132B778_MOLSC|nr:alpha/beta-hydrolase [Mollisia scopiformis]KUJ08265.1 alpha/beta-hydrolase [Mollisia scopiformis]